MKSTLKNDYFSVAVDPMGAELCSFLNVDGKEYIWQADPEVWGRHAPILFPTVGALKNNEFKIEGKTYPMARHGFARDSKFSLLESTDDTLVFSLSATPESRTHYPYEFTLKVVYRLSKNRLRVRYEVNNDDSRNMPFAIGAHPAFSCQWEEGDTISDYYLEFDQEETVETACLTEAGLLSAERERVLECDNILPLSNTLFDDDALVFTDMRSRQVRLRSTKHRRSLIVEYAAFPFLGIWSKPAAPFVCIEPWIGHADVEDHDGDFLKKPGIVVLPPGQAFDCEYSISVR